MGSTRVEVTVPWEAEIRISDRDLTAVMRQNCVSKTLKVNHDTDEFIHYNLMSSESFTGILRAFTLLTRTS